MSEQTEARREWWVAGAAIAIGAVVFGWGVAGGKSEHANITITVVPQDAEALECRNATPFGELHCGEIDGASTADANLLRPYVTVSGELLLLSSVFQQPEVTEWLKRAHRKQSSDRVTLRCEGTHRGDASSVEVRFGAQDNWRPQRNVPVLQIASCKVAKAK